MYRLAIYSIKRDARAKKFNAESSLFKGIQRRKPSEKQSWMVNTFQGFCFQLLSLMVLLKASEKQLFQCPKSVTHEGDEQQSQGFRLSRRFGQRVLHPVCEQHWGFSAQSFLTPARLVFSSYFGVFRKKYHLDGDLSSQGCRRALRDAQAASPQAAFWL